MPVKETTLKLVDTVSLKACDQCSEKTFIYFEAYVEIQYSNYKKSKSMLHMKSWNHFDKHDVKAPDRSYEYNHVLEVAMKNCP